MSGLELVFFALLIAALLALAIIDARTFRLPDLITLPLLALGLLAAFVLERSLVLHGLGAGLGYGVLVAIELGYKHLRGRDGLGRGDAKLLAAGGAWSGALALPFILLVASVSALIYAIVLKLVFNRDIDGSSQIAFGPFLAFGIALIYAVLTVWPGVLI